MRILHTSDWHLGRTLHGVNLLGHQSAYLDHLVEVVRAEGIDAVVVAGDVYDRAIPPVEAVELLSGTLRRLLEVTQVVVSPGNHDSAARLGFGADLMREGLHVRARSRDVGTAVELHDAEGNLGALVYALPYLDPDDARHVLASEDGPLARSHEAVTTAAMERVQADMARRRARGGAPVPSVLAAHTFVVGGEASESERDIRVGGVDSVPSGVFRGVDYVALGHLHGPQRVPVADLDGRRTVARYSGSPLAYSFSEMNHRKSSVVVDLRADGVHGEPELIAAPVPRRLTEVRGTLEEILGELGEEHVDCWTRVHVTDPARPENLVARVRARLPHALAVLHEPPARVGEGADAPHLTAADPFDVCCDFVTHVRGGGEAAAPDEAEQAVLRRALENVLAAERSA